jgi:hypothetical protein
MSKTLTLRMAASTLLVFSFGIALAAGPGNTGRSPLHDAAAGGDETVRQIAATTEGRVRLPRPRKAPSRAPAEIVRAQVSADPDEESTRRGVSGDAHDRYANLETSYLLD